MGRDGGNMERKEGGKEEKKGGEMKGGLIRCFGKVLTEACAGSVQSPYRVSN